MRDYGIDKGLVEFRDDSKREQRGWNKGFFSFRKMFRDYLEKLNVPFYDNCCPDEQAASKQPIRYNSDDDVIERFNTDTNSWSEASMIITLPKSSSIQSTSKTTTVTSNIPAGTITTVSLSDAADTQFTFTLNNSYITASSILITSVDMNGSGGFAVISSTPASGSANITVRNVGTSAFSGPIKINFTVF